MVDLESHFCNSARLQTLHNVPIIISSLFGVGTMNFYEHKYSAF